MDIRKARERIDRIDTAMVNLLAERMSLMPKLAEYKRRNNLPIQNKKREKEVAKRLRKLAGKKRLGKDLVERIFSIVMKESKKVQRKHLAANRKA